MRPCASHIKDHNFSRTVVSVIATICLARSALSVGVIGEAASAFDMMLPPVKARASRQDHVHLHWLTGAD
jgi:hypothetical protein